MPPLTIPSCVRASLIWTLGGSDFAVNVLHYFIGPSTTITQTDATDFAADVAAAFTPAGSWQDIVASTVSLARITLRDLRTANAPEYTASVAAAGTPTNFPLPPQTSVCVTLRTALAGRSYRGRIYLPGASTAAATTGGAMTQACADAAAVFVNDLVTVTVDAQEWSLGVASPTLGLITPVTTIAVRDLVFDTQRRRSHPGI